MNIKNSELHIKIPPIGFGTSGHRGIQGQDFRNAHVIAIAQAVAIFCKKDRAQPSIVIGYDSRHGNHPQREKGTYTQVLVDTLLSQGCNVTFFEIPVPTPLISYMITKEDHDGGLILTASHNPPEYNGLKFNPKNGAPAPPEVTQELETLANHFLHTPPDDAPQNGQLTLTKNTQSFTEQLATLSHSLISPPSFKNARIVIENNHGACAQVWSEVAQQLKLNTCDILHPDPQPDFGKRAPNPTQIHTLEPLKTKLIQENAILGIANDPDGDRHQLLDETGTPLSPEETAVIILEALKPPMHRVCGTVASSYLLKQACEKNGYIYEETAVGFKYFAPFFKEAQDLGQLSMGVESSGGFSLSNHTFDKCGFLPGLLILAICLQRQCRLSELKNDLYQRYGKWHFLESEFKYPTEKRDHIQKVIQTPDPNSLAQAAPLPLINWHCQDGLKLEFKDLSWGLIRLSGTEPVARVYAESQDPKLSQKIILSLQKWLSNQG
ncbi:MAG: hypothetical protein CL521_02020 [Actinobacteria bacterium]|nr:hypothetical protein [Actinomycetota bacterium]